MTGIHLDEHRSGGHDDESDQQKPGGDVGHEPGAHKPTTLGAHRRCYVYFVTIQQSECVVCDRRR